MNRGEGSTGYNTELKQTARMLRNSMTPEEKHLWFDCLRRYPVRFRRQRPIDRYIADFYCPLAKLVIEIDGSQHYTDEGLMLDAIRTEVIERYGIKVIRFTNREIAENFDGVCESIHRQVLARMEERNSSVTG